MGRKSGSRWIQRAQILFQGACSLARIKWVLIVFAFSVCKANPFSRGLVGVIVEHECSPLGVEGIQNNLPFWIFLQCIYTILLSLYKIHYVGSINGTIFVLNLLAVTGFTKRPRSCSLCPACCILPRTFIIMSFPIEYFPWLANQGPLTVVCYLIDVLSSNVSSMHLWQDPDAQATQHFFPIIQDCLTVGFSWLVAMLDQAIYLLIKAWGYGYLFVSWCPWLKSHCVASYSQRPLSCWNYFSCIYKVDWSSWSINYNSTFALRYLKLYRNNTFKFADRKATHGGPGCQCCLPYMENCAITFGVYRASNSKLY